MAAYASVLSLMHLIQNIQHHPRPPIHLDEDLIKPLTDNITFFQEFLERYSNVGSKEARRGLENRIAAAAYSAEDMIGSHVVDLILETASTTYPEGDFSSLQPLIESTSVILCDRLLRVAEDMDSIKNEVVEEIKGKRPLQHSNLPAGSSRPPPSTREDTMVGFDDILIDVKGKLTRDGGSNRQIIPIVGTGGIGKTTLAHNAYVHKLIVEHFDIRAWVTVSQEYSMRDILIRILSSLEKQESREKYSSMSEGDMGEQLHKHLYGKRYLIVMDDVWSIDAWDNINRFLPDNCNRSRIMITTRESQLASSLVGSHGLIEMKFLDEAKSWTLLSRKVFQEEETCPVELEEIGKKIAKNCKGLPLSISVIGGLLAKSSFTKEHWDYVAQHLSSIVNSEENQRCLEILSISYIHLPIHLKPCFLYMGVFPEDYEIHVSWLVKLWVNEGFLKPTGEKNIEVVAEDYLKDLINRNLVLVDKKGSSGNIKSCKIHDLLRDMCLREGQNEKFLCVVRDIELQMQQEVTYSFLKSLPLALHLHRYFSTPIPPDALRILSHEWNLRTVIGDYIGDFEFEPEPFRIWKMPQLRHLQSLGLCLAAPSSCQRDNGRDDFILENLQSLKVVTNFRWSEEVVNRIPNIKRLKIYYCEPSEEYSLNNLGRLHKLESLSCEFDESSCEFDEASTGRHPSWRYMTQSLTFSHSLKKLTLFGTTIPWEDITTKLSPLPHLEVLKLESYWCSGSEWNLEEDHQFRSLKYLQISGSDMEHWRAGSINFPRLEQLVLLRLDELTNLPVDIGEITTLTSIQMVSCSHDSINSAKKMAEELDNEELRVQVLVSRRMNYAEEVMSLASDNFEVEIWS